MIEHQNSKHKGEGTYQKFKIFFLGLEGFVNLFSIHSFVLFWLDLKKS